MRAIAPDPKTDLVSLKSQISNGNDNGAVTLYAGQSVPFFAVNYLHTIFR